MEAGPLRNLITIQKRTDTRDSFGEVIPTWSTFAQVHARIESVTGNESTLAKELIDSQTHRFTIRYLAGVTPKMRIVWSGRTWDINWVRLKDERPIEQELLCQETG